MKAQRCLFHWEFLEVSCLGVVFVGFFFELGFCWPVSVAQFVFCLEKCVLVFVWGVFVGLLLEARRSFCWVYMF